MRPRGRPPIPSARSSESEPVETAPIETRVEVESERAGAPVLVVEHEHRDAAGLAVAHGREPDLAVYLRGGGAERVDDRRQLRGRPVAEECERDVQVVARENAHPLES